MKIKNGCAGKLYCFREPDEYSDKITTSFAEIAPETDEQYYRRVNAELARTSSREKEERQQYELLKKKFG